MSMTQSYRLIMPVLARPPARTPQSSAAHLHRPRQLARELLHHAHDHLAAERVPDEHAREQAQLPQQLQHVGGGVVQLWAG